MNTAVSNFKPGVLGGALRKGLQSPDLERANSASLDGPSRAAIVLMSLGPEVAVVCLKTSRLPKPKRYLRSWPTLEALTAKS